MTAPAPSTQHAGPVPLLLSILHSQVEQSGVLGIFSLLGCAALLWVHDLLPTPCWGSGTGPHPAPRQEISLIKASLRDGKSLRSWDGSKALVELFFFLLWQLLWLGGVNDKKIKCHVRGCDGIT